MDPKGNFEECVPIFNALGSAVRQRILFIIGEDRRLSVQSLAEQMNLSRPTISHHLGILQNAGIIHHHKAGRERIYYFSFEDSLKKMSNLISSIETTKQ